MFEATRPFLFFDYMRVPYRVVASADVLIDGISARHPLRACGQLRWQNTNVLAPELYWLPVESDGTTPAGQLPLSSYRVDTTPLFGRVLPEATCGEWLAATGRTWIPVTPIFDARGQRVSAIWRDARGSIFLPFDPADVMQTFWSESYQTAATSSLTRRLKKLALRSYYRARPLGPRATQIRLRQVLSRVQTRAHFPRWPVEPALHELYARLLGYVGELAPMPVPWIAPWPDQYEWAIVLTHDVEKAIGYENVPLLRGVEERAGYRSSWNFVPRRDYEVDATVVNDLTAHAFEVGVHGLFHDGRDLESLQTLGERLPAIRDYARRWNAVGFRSPATHRVWDWMPLLGFDYDTSYPDTDPYEPISGGCCTWLPFFNRDMVELPITLPQDHTLFAILEQVDESTWVEKTDYLRGPSGMALLITHPDYMLEQSRLDAYGRFLNRYADDPSVWRALPREVSDWWRRRAASTPEEVNGDWRVVGPAAADARLRFTRPGRPATPTAHRDVTAA